MTELRQQIRTFIETNFLVDPSVGLKDDDSLLELNIVDSTGFLEVMHFVESTLGISITDSEMIPENLETIDNITRFVERKRAGA